MIKFYHSKSDEASVIYITADVTSGAGGVN